MRRTQRLELHGLAPELGLDADVLPELEVDRRGVTRADRRVVAHLSRTGIKRRLG